MNENAKVILLFNVFNPEWGTNFDGNVYDIDGIAPPILSRDYKGAKRVLLRGVSRKEDNAE